MRYPVVRISLAICCLYPNLLAAGGDYVALQWGGMAVYRSAIETFHKQCSARREWVELQKLPSATVEKSINRWIQRTVTVGKKLTSGDCPEEKGRESYEYVNSLKVSGQKGPLMGLSTQVYFPGGSGRTVASCEVFHLATGKHYELGKFLTTKGRVLLTERTCGMFQQAKDEYYCPTDATKTNGSDALRDATYCLTNSGVKIALFHHGNANVVRHTVEIDMAGLATLFKFPPELSKEMK